MKVSDKSLEEVHSTVDTTQKKGFYRKLLAFLGPAYLISVGYMDPGNWATDIAGGSGYGYKLIWVLLLSNLMALLLQSLSARLGIVTTKDLAQASRASYPPAVNFILYVLAEIAIAACDLAEVLGMAIGLNLLFGLPLIWGVVLTLLDTILLLFLINKGMRAMEAFILALVGIIGLSFIAEMFFAQPDTGALVSGFIPNLPGGSALYIAIGIIGATVMPHNLYLHSSIVQTRKFDRDDDSLKSAIKFNVIDSAIALNLAFFVNAAILVLAAATFFNTGHFEVTDIGDAHKFLEPLLGTKLAPILFAVALIAAGQSSTLTGTLAGQVVMEGYLNLRIQPWIRRLMTRLIAILPAIFTILLFGESKTGELLILSQVVLSLQLGFAIIPLIHFVSSKEKMGKFAIKPYVKVLSWITATIIVALNIKLVIEEIAGWIESSSTPVVIWVTVVPITVILFILLFYLIIKPFVAGIFTRKEYISPHGQINPIKIESKPSYSRIAVAVDFSDMDNETINHALSLGGKDAHYLLMHVVESAGALFLGDEIKDNETHHDTEVLEQYSAYIKSLGYKVETAIGFGNPKHVIPEHVFKFKADILLLGAHGHNLIKDIVFGTTIENVRHRIKIPILVIRK